MRKEHREFAALCERLGLKAEIEREGVRMIWAVSDALGRTKRYVTNRSGGGDPRRIDNIRLDLIRMFELRNAKEAANV